MSDDIVERLRTVLNHDRSVELITREAADEIERLRRYCAEAARIGSERDSEIQRLRRERDEARMMYCTEISCQSRYEHCTPKWAAEERGWDCFGGVR